VVLGRKVCGVLAERVETSTGPAVVIGMGINVHLTAEQLPVPTATSLALVLDELGLGGSPLRRTSLVSTILRSLERILARWEEVADAGDLGPDALSLAYRERCATIGREVRISLSDSSVVDGVARDVDAAVGPGRAVVEFGPGDGAKAALLLGGLDSPAAYVPVDIAPEWLDGAAGRVAAAHPGLPVLPVVADFTHPFALPKRLGTAPRLGFFPGSTIGNFEPEGAVAFLRRAHATLGAGSRMLLGADLVKGQAVLEAAYDDAAGVTAAFTADPSLFSADRFHPSGAGYAVIADTVAPVVRAAARDAAAAEGAA
jgi:hypothetical protein